MNVSIKYIYIYIHADVCAHMYIIYVHSHTHRFLKHSDFFFKKSQDNVIFFPALNPAMNL